MGETMIGQAESSLDPGASPVLNFPSAGTPVSVNPISRIGLALVPFTPVSFSGPDGIYAWGRLAIYGTAAALTWQKQRKLSYVLMGAAGLSLVSSLSQDAWRAK
jgi:hypothetical protein